MMVAQGFSVFGVECLVVFFSVYTIVLHTCPSNINPSQFSKMLKKSFEKHRKHLLECLAQKEKLSKTDVEWLDNEGNLINEEHVLETLDAASDFEQGVKQLLDDERAAFERLKQVADDDVGKK